MQSPRGKAKEKEAAPAAGAEKEEIAVDPTQQYVDRKDGTGLIRWDIYLEPYADALRSRHRRYLDKKREIERAEGSLLEFATGYKKFGFNRGEKDGKKGIWYREWCPQAQKLYLMGEFNGWHRNSHECEKDKYGVFSLFLPDDDAGRSAIPHNSKIKIAIVPAGGGWQEKIPAWATYVWQERDNPIFDGVYWCPPEEERYEWKHEAPPTPKDLRVYEAHVGMSSQEPKIATYSEFADDVLPHVVRAGYNAIQLMGIMEHAYYASFGYQVTNFFAISSRFGTPEDLKRLVDEAHRLGVLVFLDLVHSHASKNVADGLNLFDGTDHCYFHEGGRGYHPIWDSRLFNYQNWEVLRFLLSNARWYAEEYGFDGFRFDGVTSMLYKHHGVAHAFVGGYNEYFDPELVDEEAVMYLKLVNDVLHALRPGRMVTIAEDVSGMAGLCRPLDEGGVGFDYRLAMGIPDKWIELLKSVKDEDWRMGEIAWTLMNRRYMEANIAYAESHDQALVGDKTIAFWLMDKEMYDHMSLLQPLHPVIDRGIALHKLLRLITCALGGEGYLNFMGNEFGHPEWIDFPREGNNNSMHYARRRWDLVRDPLLRYQHLFNFDVAMNALENQYKWLPSPQAFVTLKHEGDKLITFERAGLFFVFNFHPDKSFSDYRLGVSRPGKYKVVLCSDDPEFGGHSRIDKQVEYFTEDFAWHDWRQSFKAYLPCRVALVFARADGEESK